MRSILAGATAFLALVSPLATGASAIPDPRSGRTVRLAAVAPATTGRWLTAYYPSYRQFVMAPSEIPYASMTHLVHWPVLPTADGSLDTVSLDFSAAHSADVVSRAHAAGIKVLLGVGGDAASGATAGFQGATAPANRAKFIGNIVSLMQARDYDGVDINWEAITAADDPQVLGLFRELRQALDAVAPRPLLTMPPTTGFGARPDLIAQLVPQLDQINLQTYVMSGPYPGWVTWFNSPIFNGGFAFPSTGGPVPSIDAEVDRFAAAGVPLNRMAIGVQFDGFVWAGGSGTDTGGVTKPRQTWIGDPAVTVVPYADVVNTLTAAQGFQKQFDAVARVPYLGRDRANDADDRFVSFDDEQAIEEKATYVRNKGLAGAFIFELSGDYFATQPSAQRHPLLAAAKQFILDGFVNDDQPALSIEDRTVTEGAAANTAFRVVLSAASGQTVTAGYSTVDGSATAGSDYVSTSGVLTFTPGRTQHSIFVPLLADAAPEGTEGFNVTLSGAVNATLARGTAQATILEDAGALPARLAMYRAYNGSTDYHFFTTDLASKDFAVGTLGFRDESVPIPFYVLRTQPAGSTPLFRMYNPNLGRHYYTADAGSRDELMRLGMVYERDEGFVYPGPFTGATELFRLYNNNSGTHLFTADATQKDAILATFPGIWVAHTSVGYVFTGP